MSQSGTVEASYRPYIHRGALGELADIPNSNEEEIEEITKMAARLQQPSSHPSVKLLKGQSGMFRIRSGKYRAICDLHPPKLRLLLVEHRDNVYDLIPVAKERRRDK